MANRIYGYIRVSTREQNIERQMLSLLEAGIHKKDIYVDKQSGKNFQRPAYTKMMRRVREGDLIVVKSIDRLGRNYQESWNSGVSLQKKKVPISVFRTCLCWIQQRQKTCWEPLSATLYYSFFLLLPKMSGIISGSDRRKELLQQRPAESSSVSL